MSGPLLEPRIVRMPQFAPGEWLNTNRSFVREQLRGCVLLVDFWDYTCINCIRTLPYLKQWYHRYASNGLTIIGIHSPEFKFGKNRKQVKAAVAEFEIPYPVLLDNGYKNWSRFANRAWPSKHLIDTEGYIRYRRQGEGYYRETERAIQILLRQRDPNVALPALLPALRQEDAPGAVCYRPTPELYAGYQGGGLFGGALGNPEGYVPQNPMFYELPVAEEREEGHFYVEGVWRAWPEALAYAGREGGKMVLPYRGVTVNGVLTPSADPVEMMLEMWPTEADPIVEVEQDGRFLTKRNAGADIEFAADGTSFVRIKRPRMVELVKNPTYESHELTLTFRAGGLALYAFTFTTCIAPHARPGDPDTFQTSQSP